MEYSTEIQKTSGVKRTLLIKVPKQDYLKQLNHDLRELSKKVKVKGFRQGKVPAKLVQKMFPEASQEQTFQTLSREILPKAFENEKSLPLDQPKALNLGTIEENHFEMAFEYEVKPEIKPNKYKDLAIKKEPIKIGKKEVDEVLKNMQNQMGEYEDLDSRKEVFENDHVIIDFKANHDGKAIPGFSGEGQPLLLGSGTFPGDFESKLVGKNVGEETNFDFDIPEDFKAMDLGGKTVNVDCKVAKIQKKNLPELDDKFAKKARPGINKLTELKKAIKSELESQKTQEAEGKLRTEVFDKLLENNKFEAPHSMVHQQVHMMIEMFKMDLVRGGMNPEGMNLDSKAMHDRFHDQAERAIKEMLLTEAIAIKEKIKLTDKEFEDHLPKEAERLGKSLEQMQAGFEKNPQEKDRLWQMLSLEKSEEAIIKMNSQTEKSENKAKPKKATAAKTQESGEK